LCSSARRRHWLPYERNRDSNGCLLIHDVCSQMAESGKLAFPARPSDSWLQAPNDRACYTRRGSAPIFNNVIMASAPTSLTFNLPRQLFLDSPFSQLNFHCFWLISVHFFQFDYFASGRMAKFLQGASGLPRIACRTLPVPPPDLKVPPSASARCGPIWIFEGVPSYEGTPSFALFFSDSLGQS